MSVGFVYKSVINLSPLSITRVSRNVTDSLDHSAVNLRPFCTSKTNVHQCVLGNLLIGVNAEIRFYTGTSLD